MSTGNREDHIPISTSGREPDDGQHGHWWFEPEYEGSWGSSPSQQSYLSSPDPKVAIPLPSAEGWDKWRRDSLRTFYHLEDFATPE